jgi:predicted metal-binding membrane protein
MALRSPAAGERLPLVIPAAIAAAWLAALAAEASGQGRLLHHDALIEGRLPPPIAFIVFLLAWQFMIVAMMLPSSLPMARHYAGVVKRQGLGWRALYVFLGGYAVVWTAFGAIAFMGDVNVHRVVDSTSWLQAHPWLIAGSTLAVAGGFQFSSLKNRCLTQCRQPFAFLVHQRLRGVNSPFRLGLSHGLFCLGCCWALMLLMFAAGVANMVWMAGLAAVMIYEKVAGRGERLAPVVGYVLLAWAVLVLIHPPWLPHALAGVA